jgi:hypothetical protein
MKRRRVSTDIGRFVIVPLWIIDQLPAARRCHGVAVLTALLSFADRDPALVECWPSRDQLAERAGISTETVKRTIRELERIGVVEVVSQHDRRRDGAPVGRAGFARNGYLVHLARSC